MSTLNNSNLITLNGKIPPMVESTSTPIQVYNRAVDNAIDKLLGFKAQLIKAQLAGVTTINLEDPDNGKLHAVALELAIDAVEFLCSVNKGGAA